MIWILVSLLFACFVQCCTVADGTTFTVTATSVPLIGNDAEITRWRQACQNDFTCKNKFRPHDLASNEQFMVLLQLAQPFPFPIESKSPLYNILDGFNEDEVNDKLIAMALVYAVADHYPCSQGAKFIIVGSDGQSECEPKGSDLSESVLSSNLIFYIVITAIVMLLSVYIIYLQLAIARMDLKMKKE